MWLQRAGLHKRSGRWGREESMLYPPAPACFSRSTQLLWILLLGTFYKAESNSIIDLSLSSANTFFVRSASKVSVRSKLAFHPLETQLVFSSSLIAFISCKHFSWVGGSSDSPCIINISASPADSIGHTLYSTVTKWHFTVEYTQITGAHAKDNIYPLMPIKAKETLNQADSVAVSTQLSALFPLYVHPSTFSKPVTTVASTFFQAELIPLRSIRLVLNWTKLPPQEKESSGNPAICWKTRHLCRVCGVQHASVRAASNTDQSSGCKASAISHSSEESRHGSVEAWADSVHVHEYTCTHPLL